MLLVIFFVWFAGVEKNLLGRVKKGVVERVRVWYSNLQRGGENNGFLGIGGFERDRD